MPKALKYSSLASIICLCCATAGALTPTTEPNSGAKNSGDSEQPRVAAAHNLDWVEKQDMTPQQQADLASYCCGAYIEPKRGYPDANLDPEQAPLRVNALSTEAQTESVAVLDGDVHISQGYRQVRSDSATVDQNSGQITLSGNVRFREPNMLLMGDNAKLDLNSEEVEIDNATYVLHQTSVRGTAKTLLRKTDGVILIKDATYSGCQPTDKTWQLKTSEIKIDQASGFATVKNARLDIGNMPVFYFPYAKFPISNRRSSGLLFPSIAVDKENGLDFSQPIYWNLAPNYDATLSPRFIQQRGAGLEATFRHLSNWSTTEVTAAYLGNDKGGNNDSERDSVTGLHPNEGEDRYMASIQHQGGVGRPWSTFLDFNNVSDTNYFRDMGQMTLDENSRTHLGRRASLAYRTAHWNFALETQDYQTITAGLSDQYSVLPDISIDGNYRFANSVSLDINHQHSVFDHDNPHFITGSRARLDYSVSWDKRWRWGYLKPKVGFKHLSYDLDLPTVDNLTTLPLAENPSVSVPIVSVDTGIFLDRDNSWFSGLRQTFEPRLFYLKAEFQDQQSLPDFDSREITLSYDLLFRDKRFYGGDRIADNHRLTLGLSTSFVDKQSGQERFRARLAQAVYFDDRQVAMPADPSIQEQLELRREQSLLAFELAGRINKNWRVTSEIIYDSSDNHLEKSGLSLRYNDHRDRLFNLAYRYSRRLPRTFEDMKLEQHIAQADMSFYIPMGADFNWVGRWTHDFTNRRELELFAGFEYNSCCWRASLVMRRWLEREDELLFPEQDLKPKNGIFLQIQFKSLAGTGGRVDTMLKRGIHGYEPLENF